MFFTSIYSVFSVLFLVFAKVNLRETPFGQQNTIHYFLQVLLLALVAYNNPLLLLPGEHVQAEIFGHIAEAVFISLMLYFWLVVFQQSKQLDLGGVLQMEIYIQKCMLILMYTLPECVSKIAYLLLYNELELNDRDQLPLYDWVQYVKIAALGFYCAVFAQLSCKYLRTKTNSTFLAVEGNHNFLCWISITTFLFYGGIVIKDFMHPRDHSVFSIYGAKAVFNIFMYMVTYLYLPVEREEQDNEQKYELEEQKEPDNQIHVKDMELESIQTMSAHNKSAENQKIWESVQ